MSRRKEHAAEAGEDARAEVGGRPGDGSGPAGAGGRGPADWEIEDDLEDHGFGAYGPDAYGPDVLGPEDRARGERSAWMAGKAPPEPEAAFRLRPSVRASTRRTRAPEDAPETASKGPPDAAPDAGSDAAGDAPDASRGGPVTGASAGEGPARPAGEAGPPGEGWPVPARASRAASAARRASGGLRQGAAAGLRGIADALARPGPASGADPVPEGGALHDGTGAAAGGTGRGAGIRPPDGVRAAPLTLVGPVGRIGAAASLALLAVMLLWAQVSVIGGAVIGSGEVVVRGQPKEVQSLDGGVVAAILTREGARVEAGEVLMRLDPTIPQIELDIREGRLADAVLRQRRLEAEHAGADRIDFEGLPPRVAARDLAREMEGQEAVFAARLAVLESRRDGLAARAEAAEEEIAATEARVSDLEGRLSIARGELERTRSLVEQGLAARPALAEAEGRVSALTADLASERVRRQQADAGIREARLAVVEAERRFREEAVTELREASLEREQLMLDIARLEKDIARADLVAPAAGIVHDLRVATRGGVVAPGETVMQIVPVGEGVEFAVRIDPRAIDEVHVGQLARLVLPAFGGAAAPELAGRVAQVPPAARTDPQTGLAHYLLSVEVAPEEIARLGGGELVPGMPVEAFLATAERSVLAYLLGPLTEQLRRAFREG